MPIERQQEVARLTWHDRPLDSFTEDDLLQVRAELITAGRTANTLNHYRRIIRGAFGTRGLSPALAWDWAAVRPESEGQLRYYTPGQVAALKRHAHAPLDVAIYTLAAEAGPRLSEVRGLKVRKVDFAVGVVRFEDGFTTRGGHAGNKGRRVRSVPMSDNVRAALWPYCQRPPRRRAGIRARDQARRADLRQQPLPPVPQRRQARRPAGPPVP